MKKLIKPSANTQAKRSGKDQRREASPIAWHPAFVEALQLELEAYQDYLEFYTEYQLSSEPLRIDCLVIKKSSDLVIKKNIASIFREVNLLEYKSPDDYISVADFYKVYGYACLYASFEKVPVTNMTISFVGSRYPKELLKHFREIRLYKVEETNTGIYNIAGDLLSIQIIDSRKLSAEENLWLRGLYNKLSAQETRCLFLEADRQGKAARIHAYVNVIARANYQAVEEAMNMSDAVRSLEDVLEVTGFNARVEERKALAIATNMINLGFPPETVAAATMLDPEKVKALYKK